jgi:ABC-type lipoprotein export system ATPase subunit
LIGKASEKVAHEGNVNTAMVAMVEARGVEKEYATGGARVRALRGVDLSIPRGEMVAVMGPSGCGKTTLLNCLSGLDEFDRGEVFVGGESISGMSDRKRTRFRAEKMGFIFQTYNLIPVLSAVENVELPLLVAGTRPKEARGKALSALETVGIPEQAHKRPNEMSGGQQQRVTVARREQGQTFVLVTHDASVAARAHRTVRMRDGLIEGDEPSGGSSGKEV